MCKLNVKGKQSNILQIDKRGYENKQVM